MARHFGDEAAGPGLRSGTDEQEAAIVTAPDKAGRTPAAWAAAAGQLEVLRWLLEGAQTGDGDPLPPRDRQGWGPLHYVCQLLQAELSTTDAVPGPTVQAKAAALIETAKYLVVRAICILPVVSAPAIRSPPAC